MRLNPAINIKLKETALHTTLMLFRVRSRHILLVGAEGHFELAAIRNHKPNFLFIFRRSMYHSKQNNNISFSFSGKVPKSPKCYGCSRTCYNQLSIMPVLIQNTIGANTKISKISKWLTQN